MLPENLVTKLPGGGYLLFSGMVYAQCQLFAQKTHRSPESGGVLIGCIRDTNLEITGATFPDSTDKQSRFAFVRQSVSHVRAVYNAWKQSGQTNTYLGEWHTHPEPNPTPSSTDYRQWRKKLPKRPMILMIVGTNKVWLGFWEGSGQIKTLPELKSDIITCSILKHPE